MQGINVKDQQEWPDGPEGASEDFQKLLARQRNLTHKKVEQCFRPDEEDNRMQ